MATHTPTLQRPAVPGPGSVTRNRTGRAIGRVVVLVLILGITLYPLFWLFGSSLKSQTEIVSNLSIFPEEVTWSNYTSGWSSPGRDFVRYFLNSTMLATMVVAANAIACVLTAFAFARLRFRGRGLWFSLMIGTLLLPHQVLLIPQFILFKTLGWLDTFWPLVVPKALATETFFIFLMVQFIRGIPRELDEAEKMDGCSEYRVFRNVILPLAKPALVTTAIFSFIWTWNDFFTQLIYLSSPTMITVPIGLRNFMTSDGQTELGPMFAMSMLSLVPIFLFFVSFQRMLVQGINTSGIKG
jgi:multiple sugar transport system permease protein